MFLKVKKADESQFQFSGRSYDWKRTRSSDKLAERTEWHCENDAVNMKYNGFDYDSFLSLVMLFM
jgi:hypothetical protein